MSILLTGCDLDLSSVMLICVDEFSASYKGLHGLQVSVLDVGELFARVSHSSIPGGTTYVTLCERDRRQVQS